MRTVVVTVLVCLAALLLGGLAFVYSGVYDISATSPHIALGQWLADTLVDASIEARAGDVEVPPLDDPAMRETGFVHYHEMCVTCHAAPGVRTSEIGSGLYPAPPDLSEEVEEWNDAQLFWIVKHGIKMSGMPAYGPTHSDGEIWAVVAFLRELPELSAEEYAARVEAAGLAESPGHEHAS